MKKKTLYWLLGIGVLLLLILILVGRNRGDRGTSVAVEAAAVHTIIETVNGSGKIYPVTEVKIAPEVSGEIIELRVQEGDSVRRGQMLVRVNPTIYSSMVNQAEASVSQSRASSRNSVEMAAQARSQYALARSTFERNERLYKDKVISSLEFEQARASFESAKATYEAALASSQGGQFSVKGAQAGLSQAQENLRKTTIVAPVDGVISQLGVKLGERVVGTAQMAGTNLLSIADMSRMEVRVDVSETDIAKVKVGDTTIIEADAYRNRKFKGVVSAIDVSAGGVAATATQLTNDQVTNYTVRILILPSSYEAIAAGLPRGKFVFKPGMSASVEIQTRKEPNILSVPVNAVTTRDWPDSLKKPTGTMDDAPAIRQLVFLLDPATKQVRGRDVTTGIQDNQYIQVLTGLRAGDQVVVAPYGAITRQLKDGSKVNVVKKESLFENTSE